MMDGCSVWWLLLVFCFLFNFGRMMTYLWISHSISMPKSCGGDCKKLVIWCVVYWVNLSHSHWSWTSRMMAMEAPKWSNI